MKQSVVLATAREVLSKYHLDDWTICLDTPLLGERKRLAQARFLEKEIGIVFSDWRRVPDTEAWREELRGLVLHEVAHVIAGINAGHNETWRDMFIALLEEWFAPMVVTLLVCGCSEISNEWIQNEWVPRRKALLNL